MLSHGDFNAGNVLFERGALSGVVDWETAESAPPGSDLGACWFDCRVTGSAAAAEALLEGYGGDVAGSWFWELVAGLKFVSLYREWLPTWHRFGLTALDEATIRGRIDDAVRDALARSS